MANKSLLKYISGVGTKIIQTSIMVAIIKILNIVPRPGFCLRKIHKDKTVSAEFSGDEKRLILIQASGPVVLTGGGRSGCAPMGYFLNDSDIRPVLSFRKFYALIKPVHEG